MSILPVHPRHDFLFVDIIDRNVTIKDLGNGKVLHLLADDTFGQGPHDSVAGKHPGIRPRWARVLEVGPEVADEVIPGSLVLCDTLKWGHGIPFGRCGFQPVYFWRINVKDILLVGDDESGLDYFRELLTQTEITLGQR